MKLEHQKMKKTQRKYYLIKQIVFTERNCVGSLLVSPTFTCDLFIIMLLQIKKGKGNWPLWRGETLKIRNLIMWRADTIFKTGTAHKKSTLAKRIGAKCSVTTSLLIPHLQT